ncbi:MAG TPA: chemotaxis response regulator protein-glutamate methylesterase [Verrucomicrobiales bacterium]|nr:chemotaxis response regulator protein-glutamate methylesterase [Verrucomicrobiales bacterium]HIL70398.1 chemotaxis response regulator protein-glutamate methylesterase [Verrucomicrobiota bacterium]
MPKHKILIVDDSSTMRRRVASALTSDPELEVVGYTANGKIAPEKIPQLNPDLVTLDVEMPVMNGLETLAAIRKKYGQLPVIMFSTVTHRGASTTLDALFLGASDYFGKPTNVSSFQEAVEKVQVSLVPKIKALCGKSLNTPSAVEPRDAVRRSVAPPTLRKNIRPAIARGRRKSIGILAIGVSTGGPNALSKVIPELPVDFPVPVVIVQHMPPVFTGFLAESLSRTAKMPVCEAVDGPILKPGEIWIARGGCHMIVKGNTSFPRICLNEAPPENSCRPSVDVLFRSVLDVYGARILAVILTGMGKDGLVGAELIHNSGGKVFAQDEASSVVWGMPGAVARAGIAQKILPLELVASNIVSTVYSSRIKKEPEYSGS